jgi:hypothetical protein
MAICGHENIQTTQGYVQEGELLRDALKDVFPPLPVEVLDVPEPAAQAVPKDAAAASRDVPRGPTAPVIVVPQGQDRVWPDWPRDWPEPRLTPQNHSWVGRDSNPGPTG